MKKVPFLSIISFLMIAHVGYCQKWGKCEIRQVTGSIIRGFCQAPNVKSRVIKYKKLESDKKIVELNSNEIISLTRKNSDNLVQYDRVQVLKWYGNKKVGKNKFWLKSLNKGVSKLYAGEFKANGIITTIWYILKEGDTAAFYVAMNYSGGMVMTIGANKEFRKNTTKCFNDYPELLKRIKNKEFKLDQISEVVDIYNDWKRNY